MGTGSPDAEVGDDFPLFFLSTSNPVSNPHVNTTTMTTSRDIATPITAAVFRASRTSGDVSIACTYSSKHHHMNKQERDYTCCVDCCDV